MHSPDNLIGSVADAIAKNNPSAAMRFTRNFHCNSNDQRDQIVELNRYWRNQLHTLHISTISERTCLIDDIAPKDWLRHFCQLVVPTIVTYELPAPAKG